MFGWLKSRADQLFGGPPRSSKWPRVRADHLRREPFCQACGSAKDLEVHHVIPVQEALATGRQELELDAGNLITLCGGTRNCHLAVGHAHDWRSWRPDVRSLAATLRNAEVRRR